MKKIIFISTIIPLVFFSLYRNFGQDRLWGGEEQIEQIMTWDVLMSTGEVVQLSEEDKKDPDYIECKEKEPELARLPKTVMLFGKTLSINGVNCEKDAIWSLWYATYFADKYFSSDRSIIAAWRAHIDEETLNNLLAWSQKELRKLNYLLFSTEAVYSVLQDITKKVIIPEDQKSQMWNYKILLSAIGGDWPTSNWNFIISIMGEVNNLVYFYNYSSAHQGSFTIPDISSIITQASNKFIDDLDYGGDEKLFDWNYPTNKSDRKIFDELVLKFTADEKARHDIKFFSSHQYISTILENNPEYQKIIKEKWEELVRKLFER